MGTTTSREGSTRHKYRRKLASLKSQKSREIIMTDSKPSVKTIESTKPSSAPATIPVYQPTPVNLVKHQVVLSDHVSPMSSLSAVISIPMRRSSWRKSVNTATTRTTNDNGSMTSGSFFDDDIDDDAASEVISSPRTSVGSEDNTFLKVEDVNQKKKIRQKTTSPLNSFKSSYRKEGNDIVFESKYNTSPTASTSTPEPFPNGPPRPFWSYNNGDEREYDRQLRQHYVLKHILDGNIHVPVPTDKGITILDSACGAGFWTLDMAQAFPNAKVIGLDAFPPDDKRMKGYSNATMSPPNVVYKYGDLTTQLNLPANYIDVLYQRDTTSIIPHERWPFLFGELVRVIKPGGYVELVEYDFNIRDPGPVLALINEWYKIASTSVGVDPREAKQLETKLTSAGFENVEKKVVSIPIGEWPTEKDQREKGFLYKQVIKALFKSMRRWWIAELGITEQEYNKVVIAAMDEFDEQQCYIDWVIYTAKKPLEATATTTNTTITTTTTTTTNTTTNIAN